MNIKQTNKIICTVVPESKNIIKTFVESMITNESYKKYVKKLSESGDEKKQKMAQRINTTIKTLKAYESNDNLLFLASDIGILLGISRINFVIRKFDDDEKINGCYIKNNKEKECKFLTRHGVYRAAMMSRKSDFGKLLKNFFYTLIDHMLLKKPKVVRQISTKFQIENPELVKRGIEDLSNKLTELEAKYIDEQKKSKLLNEKYMAEQSERIRLQDEKTIVEITNSYNSMYIEQLKQEKDKYLTTIKNINETIVFNETNSIDNIEIRLLKEKFMKPIYVYILHPDYFNKLLIKRKKQLETSSEELSKNDEIIVSDYSSDDELNKSKKNTEKNILINKNREILLIESLINDNTYKNNFINIFSKNEICIEPDEILYFSFSFNRNIAKKDKLILVNIQYVANKLHYNNIQNVLLNTCETLFSSFMKTQLYKTTLEDIIEVIKEEFINL